MSDSTPNRDEALNNTVVRGIVTDIGSLWRVDWTELGASFIEVLDEGVSD